MADSAVDLLQAVVARLKAEAGMSAFVSDRVHGATPPSPKYPFVLVTSEAQPFAAGDFSGMQHTVRVQAFARENKPGMVLAIRKLAFAALDRREADIAIGGGFELVSLQYDGVADDFPEDDGNTWQSVIEFSAIVT
ncbi:DUF3168 domain-containing protein [Methylopila sp. 73B]|uniref:DUF3168 domain-containing protein n=1 Tax=Methylopila sp. 73B TaxID=1120792 RepID=UPI0003716DB3|nr:DUF3168 domain-containing protein [Methylopila sp. 73B]